MSSAFLSKHIEVNISISKVFAREEWYASHSVPIWEDKLGGRRRKENLRPALSPSVLCPCLVIWLVLPCLPDGLCRMWSHHMVLVAMNE